VEAMKNGAFDYIPKPFTPDQLRIVVRKALENRNLVLETKRLRKEREKGLMAIAHEKGRIRTIMNSIPGGIIVVDDGGMIVLCNPAAEKLLGISAEETVGLAVGTCVDCDDFCGMIESVYRGTCGTENVSGECVLRNGTPVAVSVSPVRIEEIGRAGAVAVLRDATNQKALEKMKSDFVSKMTHELRTPVATINQLLMNLEEGLFGELAKEQYETVERAKQWGIGLLDLITDILNLSKVETCVVNRKVSPVDLNGLITGLSELFVPLAAEKNISVNFELEKSLPRVSGQADALEEVFMNLISNAVKYTGPGGKITVSSSHDRSHAIVSVEDNGIGIERDEIPKLFERFYRIKNNKTRKIIGTGLGLSIVKEVVEAHDGAVEVKSAEGRGSVFTVKLPFERK